MTARVHVRTYLYVPTLLHALRPVLFLNAKSTSQNEVPYLHYMQYKVHTTVLQQYSTKS